MTNQDEMGPINDAIYLRGLFIQRYSGIEFSLTELIMRARQHSAYADLGDLPFPFNKRMKRLEQLIAAPGPIAPYGDELRNTFGDFAQFGERRDFLVHGIMTPLKGTSDPVIFGFRLYNHKPIVDEDGKRNVVHMGRMDSSLEQLEALATALHPTAAGFAGLVARICREAPLPPLYEYIE